jgi:Zn ribbon nucleic-acid-binding protein
MHKICPACGSDSKRVKWLGALYFVVCLVCGFTGKTAASEVQAWVEWDQRTRRMESYSSDG